MPSLSRGSTRLMAAAVCVMSLLFAACEGEFAHDPTRPRPTRAVQNPYNTNSGSDEVMTASTAAIPLVAVDYGDTRQDKPKVTTLLDPFHVPPAPTSATTQPAAPATQPGTAEAPRIEHIKPITSSSQVRVASQSRSDDTFAITTDNEANIRLAVTSPSGVGSVTLERTADSWPAVIHITLQHAAGKQFPSLERFNAGEVTEQGRRVDLKADVHSAQGTADITIPGFVRSPRIVIGWVDAFR